MPDKDEKQRDPLLDEEQRPISQAEGERTPGEPDVKVMRNPDQAEGDRETIEEDIERKQP